MKHLYFFVSSNNDEVSGVTILTTSVKKAFALANKHFINNNYKGTPELLAI